MEAVETKIQLLGSVLSQLQQPGSCNMDDVKHLSGVVASQGLLNASSVAKDESLVKWCQAVSTWFQYFLDQLSVKQVPAQFYA